MSSPSGQIEIFKLVSLIQRLRAPNGCPWDQEQVLGDLRAYLLEEAHEAAAAIDTHDWTALREELGDLLFQICFVCELAQEASQFGLNQVVNEIHDKMVARHPHVFGTSNLKTSKEVERVWEHQKLRTEGRSVLAGVPTTVPALTGALRLGQKAAGVGFDWNETRDVLAKVEEELGELRSATDGSETSDRVEEELGDLLFALASLARHLRLDPERALARANLKFRKRFAHLEHELGDELKHETVPDQALRQRLEELWDEAKRIESGRPPQTSDLGFVTK